MTAAGLLVVKLLLAPLLVLGSTLLGRRFGPAVAGLLVSLPVTAGPVLLIVALDHDARFTHRTAGAALLGLVGLAAFCVAACQVVRFARWPWVLAGGWAAFLVTGLALSRLAVPVPVAFVAALATFVVATQTIPARAGAAPGLPAPRWDLPLRMVVTAGLVLLVSSAATVLGPRLTGVYTPAPVALGVLVAFSARQQGAADVAALLRGFLRGASGFALFFVVVAELILRTSTAVAFTAALLTSLLVALVLRPRPTEAAAGLPALEGS